ncbi:MAG TPA: SH3 domain-containing protein [Tepidisphaeraceae bacterium]|jgi:uncharacterized protein YgiM (DUF1202 family)
MSRISKVSSSRVKVALMAAVIGTGGALVMAGDLFVQPERLDVREGPGLLFDPVESVTKSVKLQELERTDDGWIKVQTPGGKQGYVFKGSVGDKPPSAPGALSAVNMTSDSEAAQMSTGAAAKGLEPEAEKYAANKNYNKAALDKVVAMNKSVKGAQWMQFCTEGQVGPAKPKKK